MREGFPSFEPAFQPIPSKDPVDPPPPYLIALNLNDHQAEAVQVIRSCLASSSDPRSEIAAMLAQANWRPHLVAAVATIGAPPDARPVDELWVSIGAGSWVSPQLLATASHVDHDFTNHLDALAGDLDDPPGAWISGKTAGAMLALGARDEQGRLAETAASDEERIGDFAPRWLQLVLSAFAEGDRMPSAP